MKNKSIINIIIANFLWSLIPIFVSSLFDTTSIIMVIFLRFIISGLFFLLLALILILINNRFTERRKIPFKIIFHILRNKNQRFLNLKNISYFTILGFFGIIMQLIFYFLGLKTTTIALTMIGFQISIILVAVYEHGVKTEKLGVFKILYLLILVFSISIIIYVKLSEAVAQNQSLNLLGIIYVILFGIFLTFFQIFLNRDRYSEQEIDIMTENHSFKVIRLLIKISLTFLFGILCLMPLSLILLILPLDINLFNETVKFFTEFQNIFPILIKWQMIFLIVFSTIIPFLLVFISSITWKPYSLTYSQWNSILTLIEPIGGLFFGVLLIGEYFPWEFLAIVIFLLLISILFRYVHESTNVVNAYLFLKLQRGFLSSLPLKLLEYHGVNKIEHITGLFDMKVTVKTNSIRDFYYLVNDKLRNYSEIKSIAILFIDKIFEPKKTRSRFG
ncbi:MAG: EamA family transporter [Candidatus Lokiarchaeota archaeon]